jgi:hypothetical protein
MAVEINLTDIGSGYNRTTINDNFAAIAAAFEVSLGRAGTTPNSMETDLDLDSNDLLNVGDINASRIFIDGEEFVPASVSAVGDRGWSPSFAVVSDSARRVLQLTGYVGGEGTEPTDNVGQYVGATQMETLVANGVDIRGAQGASGAGTGDMLAAQNLNDVVSKPTAFANIKQNASETATGVVELATTVEAAAGIDTTRAVTAAGLTAFAAANPAGAMVVLDEGTVTSASSLDIIFTGWEDYKHIRVVLTAVRPSTNGANLLLRFSTNGGSSFDAGVSDYSRGGLGSFSTNNSSNFAGISSSILVENDLGSGSTSSVFTDITVYDWQETGAHTMAFGTFMRTNSQFALSLGNIGGHRTTNQNTDAIRFLMSTGNIANAKYTVYGLT